ncbi:MAG: FMN-binding protein [Lentisphaeria bacterium]|nr:FMN-binding protein [Lentisphaeria bacterium]
MKFRILIIIPALTMLTVGCGGDSGNSAQTAASSDAVGGLGAAVGGEYGAFIMDIKTALPRFASFGKRSARRVDLLDGDGNVIGRLFLAPAGKYPRTEGFNGYVDTAVVLTPDDRIAGVAVGKNEETPRWLKRVRGAGFLTRWNGRSVGEAAELQVDAVTGATYSSTAIKDEVRTILNQ